MAMPMRLFFTAPRIPCDEETFVSRHRHAARQCRGYLFAILIVMITLGAWGCAASGKEEISVVDKHTSRISLDWDGTYAGILPCANCEGIETFLTLSVEGTFVLRTRYLGKDDQMFTEQGSFVWEDNGNVIRLQDMAHGPDRYHVAENLLFQLDLQGEAITGNLADLYSLRRIAAEKAPSPHDLFTVQGWRLVELPDAHDVPLLEYPLDERPWIQFELQHERVLGFAGCNRLVAGFFISPGAILRFGPTATTKMRCPDMRMETAFLDALAATQAYQLNTSGLTLLDVAGRPLARLEKHVP